MTKGCKTLWVCLFVFSSISFQLVLPVAAEIISGNHCCRCCVWLEVQLSGRSTLLTMCHALGSSPALQRLAPPCFNFVAAPITSVTSKLAYNRNVCPHSLEANGLNSQGRQDHAVSKGSMSDFCGSGGCWCGPMCSHLQSFPVLSTTITSWGVTPPRCLSFCD